MMPAEKRRVILIEVLVEAIIIMINPVKRQAAAIQVFLHLITIMIPVDAILQPVFMVPMIVRRYGHCAASEIMFLRRTSLGEHLFGYTMPSVLSQ